MEMPLLRRSKRWNKHPLRPLWKTHLFRHLEVLYPGAIMNYKQTESQLIYSPLWWHERGLSQTATGYGRKLTTPYKVEHNGRLYRVYRICFSNAGSLYILPGGKPLYLSDSNTFRPDE